MDLANRLELPLDETGRQVGDLVVVALDAELRGRLGLQLRHQFDHELGILVAFLDPVGNGRRGGLGRLISPDRTDRDQRDETGDKLHGKAAWHFHQDFSFHSATFDRSIASEVMLQYRKTANRTSKPAGSCQS